VPSVGSSPATTTDMNKTTLDELQKIIANSNLSEVMREAGVVGVPIRLDNPTPELLAAIKDTDAFERYLEQSKY
jgi:hypothetical protein